jgi:glycolate dehydrogenase FAD-binding subunit
MTATIRLPDAKAVEQAVQWALSEGKSLEIVAGGSKRGIGRPLQTELTLDLSALSGVTLYEPAELVLSAKAGTPLAKIETLVSSHGQQLAFEPMDYGPLLTGIAGSATIGGTLAANVSGPRRIKAGAARDHFLGFTAVSGRGETFKSGGRVVKNVTGYDLCKLMAGSWGTLAAMTDVTIKTLPLPETEITVLIRGLDPRQAVAAMTEAMVSNCDVSAAAHLPEEAARRLPIGEIAGAGSAVTALRLEGFSPSVAQRKGMLEALLKRFGELAEVGALVSRALWQAIRDVKPFAASRDGMDRPLWRLSTAAASGADLAERIAAATAAEMLFDWAGGLMWVAMQSSDDAGARVIARAIAATGGHATLIRAAPAVRAAIDVFPTQDAGLASLTKRVKESFDPNGVLNPGRMWAGV